MNVKKIKIGNMSDNKNISWDSSKSLYKVYTTRGCKLIHIAYFKSIEESKMLAGLITNVMRFHDLSNVTCIRTYILQRFENIKRIMEEDKVEQEKKKYKKKRKYLNLRDIYGSDGVGEGSEYDYSDSFKENWDALDGDETKED